MTYDPRVRIHCQFGWHPDEDHPELLAAWDDFDVDHNPEGFEQACRVALDRREIPDRYARRARLLVNWDEIEKLYADVEINAGVEA